VGGPSPNAEMKLVSLPQMNYLVTDKSFRGMPVKGCGEICVRGLCIMREYYRNPEATAKAIDSDGFYHTGDVGCILPNGTFKIFDRVGNVFKLSLGEYVQPEKVENICLRSSFVASIFVHGDAFHPKLVAIVVPDPDYSATWAKENGVADSDVKALAKNEAFRKAIITDIDKVGKKNGLQSYEIPKDVFLEPEPFSVETVLTPTLKMQRKKAMDYYSSPLNAMLGAPS
jgi:long-chain acyl-CoA synthetase